MTAYPRNTVALLVHAALATLTACRFGGPSGNPEAYVSFPSDASAMPGTMDASMVASPIADAGSVPDEAGALDRGSPGPSGSGDAASGDAGSVDGGFGGGQDACSSAASVAVCDPIHNTGCNPLQQCDVDPSVQSPPTGLCLFNSAQAEGGACTMSIVSESCSPGSTCVSGTCRQLCACDGDCMSGECCSDTGGPPGFLLCQPCP
jgi:hypothetical protein